MGCSMSLRALLFIYLSPWFLIIIPYLANSYKINDCIRVIRLFPHNREQACDVVRLCGLCRWCKSLILKNIYGCCFVNSQNDKKNSILLFCTYTVYLRLCAALAAIFRTKFHGNKASSCLIVSARGGFLRIILKYSYGCSPLALAVSIKRWKQIRMLRMLLR